MTRVNRTDATTKNREDESTTFPGSRLSSILQPLCRAAPATAVNRQQSRPMRSAKPGSLNDCANPVVCHMDPKDLTTYLGLAAVYLLSVNVLLGLLMSARYNPWKRWPHRRINLLKLHNWTAYVALGLAASPSDSAAVRRQAEIRVIGDILWPISSPQQPVVNTIGAIALYLLAFTVITSIYRAEIGRQRWKPLHYLTYSDRDAVRRPRRADRPASQRLADRPSGRGESRNSRVRTGDSRRVDRAISMDRATSEVSAESAMSRFCSRMLTVAGVQLAPSMRDERIGHLGWVR